MKKFQLWRRILEKYHRKKKNIGTVDSDRIFGKRQGSKWDTKIINILYDIHDFNKSTVRNRDFILK